MPKSSPSTPASQAAPLHIALVAQRLHRWPHLLLLALPLWGAPAFGASSQESSVDAPAAGTAPAATSDARQTDRLVRLLRKHQQDSGVWQVTALRSLDDFRNLHDDIDSQRPKAIAALLRANRKGQADQARAQAALTALETGDTRAAVDLLASWESAAAGGAVANAGKAAELARHQGALLAGHDVEAAKAAYTRAGQLERGDVRTLLVMSDLASYLNASVPSAGLMSTAQARAQADQLARAGGEVLALGRVQIQARVQGGQASLQTQDTATALLRFNEALAQAQQLAADSLTNNAASNADNSAGLQRDISIIHNKIGDALQQQGQTAEAVAAYQRGLAVRERLAAATPAVPEPGAQSQRDLIQSLHRVADLQARQGQAAEALRLFERAAGVAQRLVARQPALIDAQRDLAGSLERVGELKAQAGQRPAASTALTQALSLRQALAARDTGNIGWQREWAASLEQMSDMQQASNDRSGALAGVRKSLALRTALLAADPANTGLQRDLTISQNRLGDLLAAQGERTAAVAEYRKALAQRQAAAEREPTNAQALRDLSVSQTKLGDTLALTGDQAGSLTALQDALKLRQSLVQRDGSNVQSQGDLALALGKLSTANQLPIAERQALLEQGQAILDKLKEQGRLTANSGWVAWFDAQRRLLAKPVVIGAVRPDDSTGSTPLRLSQRTR